MSSREVGRYQRLGVAFAVNEDAMNIDVLGATQAVMTRKGKRASVVVLHDRAALEMLRVGFVGA